MELRINGNDKKLVRLAKELRLRAKRDGLIMSMEDGSTGKKPEGSKPEKIETKPTKQQAKSGSDKTTGKK